MCAVVGIVSMCVLQQPYGCAIAGVVGKNAIVGIAGRCVTM